MFESLKSHIQNLSGLTFILMGGMLVFMQDEFGRD